MNFIARQTKLAVAMRKAGLEALLLTHLPNIRYLCGFTGTAGALILQAGPRAHKATFYTDGRYTQQAREEIQNARVVIGKRAAFAEACAGAEKANIGVLGFEAEHLSFSASKQLAEAVRGKARVKPAIEVIRMRLRPK